MKNKIDQINEVNEATELINELEKNDNEFDRNNTKNIINIKIWKIFAYFVIYSFLGFIIETLYGVITKGVLESRKSFLYGPFCSIYGLGAVIMILSLQKFRKKNITLFFGGYIVGSIIEYFASLFCEMILHVKWWDYSYELFNLNGRVCLTYSIFWGILAIVLIKIINPRIDKFIDYIKEKLPQHMLPIIFNFATIFLILDCIISGIAVNFLYARLSYSYNIDIPNAEIYRIAYKKSQENEKWFKFTEKYFSNKKILKTYPNLKCKNNGGDIIFLRDIITDVKPYYFKFFDAKKFHLLNN